MPGTFTDLLFHMLWSTKNREPTIAASFRARLHAFMGGIVNDLHAVPIQIGGVEDHVHVIAKLPPTLAVSDFMRNVKTRSSSWVHENFDASFAWQEGYAGFTVSASVKAAVIEYIRNQEEHHRKKTFKEELIEFLQRHGVEYDPKYLD